MTVSRLDHVRLNIYRLSGGKRKALVVVTIIEIRPFRNGWEVYESPGVQPVCERSNLLFQMRKFVLA